MEAMYLTLDWLGLVATAIMLHLTREDHWMTTDTPQPTDEQRIHAMLDDAVNNDYDITTWTADDIVADLLAYADLKESEGEAEIKPHVISWKLKRSATV